MDTPRSALRSLGTVRILISPSLEGTPTREMLFRLSVCRISKMVDTATELSVIMRPQLTPPASVLAAVNTSESFAGIMTLDRDPTNDGTVSLSVVKVTVELVPSVLKNSAVVNVTALELALMI